MTNYFNRNPYTVTVSYKFRQNSYKTVRWSHWEPGHRRQRGRRPSNSREQKKEFRLRNPIRVGQVGINFPIVWHTMAGAGVGLELDNTALGIRAQQLRAEWTSKIVVIGRGKIGITTGPWPWRDYPSCKRRPLAPLYSALWKHSPSGYGSGDVPTWYFSSHFRDILMSRGINWDISNNPHFYMTSATPICVLHKNS